MNMNTRELEKEYPAAFKALPECYQADDCLEFFIDHDWLMAVPKPGQESVLGELEWWFDSDSNQWEECEVEYVDGAIKTFTDQEVQFAIRNHDDSDIAQDEKGQLVIHTGMYYWMDGIWRSEPDPSYLAKD